MLVKYVGRASDQHIPIGPQQYARLERGGPPVDVPDAIAVELCVVHPRNWEPGDAAAKRAITAELKRLDADQSTDQASVDQEPASPTEDGEG